MSGLLSGPAAPLGAAVPNPERPRSELGAWLRAQRRERAWNVPEMTRRLRQAATDAGDRLPSNDCLFTMIRRWERGETGVSERYRLYYCRAFDIDADDFGPPASPRGGQPCNGGGAQPDAAGLGDPGDRRPLAGLLRDIRDGLREDAKVYQGRAEQMTAFAICAALYRGQALACAAAAEHIDAALATEPPPPPRPIAGAGALVARQPQTAASLLPPPE